MRSWTAAGLAMGLAMSAGLSAARGAVVTERFVVTSENFADPLFGTAPPLDAIGEIVTVTFDPAVAVTNSIVGINTLLLQPTDLTTNAAVISPPSFSYDPTTSGGLLSLGSDATDFDTPDNIYAPFNDFIFTLANVQTTPTFVRALYTHNNPFSAWQSTVGQVSSTFVPEPASLAILAAVPLLIGRRRRGAACPVR